MNQLTLRELKTLIRLVVHEELEAMKYDRAQELERERRDKEELELLCNYIGYSRDIPIV